MLIQTEKSNKVISLLSSWLESKVKKDSFDWLQSKIALISANAKETVLFTSYSAVCRYFPPEKLSLTASELELIPIPGWHPQNWCLDAAARSLLLLSFPAEDPDQYLATLDKIIGSANVREAIAFYQTLPLFPYPEKFKLRAAEGIRSNMTSVFNAVAHDNPYPAEYLDDLAWNQMVLKALFVGSSLHLIYGLEQRNNPQLAQMLIDYARERLAAHRSVSDELWDLVMPFQPETVRELKAYS
ncbi:MAG: EboA domain-containing protein [Cyanobacteria bacterium J06600_6]